MLAVSISSYGRLEAYPTFFRSQLRRFTANDGGVVTTESKAVVHRDFDLHLAGVIRCIVKVAVRVRRIEINRGWYDIVVATQDGKNHFNTSTGTECMS